MTRSGAEYVRGLQDGRAVFVGGERVGDVTVAPAFAAGVQTVARLYDLAADPANREWLTYPSPRDGRPVNLAYLIPRCPNDLTRRRHLHAAWADATFGLFGRSPDHVASFFAGFAGAPELYARGSQELAENLLRFHARASDEDLYLSYAIVHPTVDRSRPAHQQAEPFLYAGALEERDGGVVMHGAQMLATGAVMSDWIFVSVIAPQRVGDEDYAVSFVVPNNAPGVRIYPRRPYALGATSVFDYPLSSRFDETDSLIVLDHVFVPWEQVFIYRNVELTHAQFFETAAHVLGNTQAQIRFSSKLKLLVGLVKRICDRSGQTARPDVQSQIGDLAARAALVEGLVLAAEANPFTDASGVVWPNPALVYANQTLQSSLYPEVVALIRGMMGGSLLQLPGSVADLAGGVTRLDLNRYVRWPGAKAPERVKLLKLLWDLIGSEFASRQIQYEMFYAGQPAAVMTREFRTFDWGAPERLVDQCLASYA